MNKRLLVKISLSAFMFFSAFTVHSQAFPSYVNAVNYSTDIAHTNTGGISRLPNSVAADNGDGTPPDSTVSPVIITDINGALVDGFHYEIGGIKFFSLDVDALVNGVSVMKSDIIRCDNFNCNTFSYYFDSLAQNLQHININAFTFDTTNGDLIFSVDGPATVGPLGVLAADLVRFDGTNFTLEYDSTSSIDGVGVGKNITGLSMMTTGEYAISFENDGEYKNEFHYYNHWILKYSPNNRSWQWFYTLLSFGELENPLRITSLMIRENDLIFKNNFE